MPKDHRGGPVNGPARNCASCGNAATERVGKYSLCKDCTSDYNTYLPWMPKGSKPTWGEEPRWPEE